MLDGICEKSPLALDKAHAYGANGKCIYCDHLDTDKIEIKTMGDSTWRKLEGNKIPDADGEYLVCRMEKAYVRYEKLYDYMSPGEPLSMEATHYHVEAPKKKRCPGITNIDKQAAIAEMNGQVSSVNARVAGMVAENNQMLVDNQRLGILQAMPYDYDDFAKEASNIDHYVSTLRVMRKHL